MLTGDRTRRVEIPHEEGQWIELKELSGRQLRKIRKLKFKESIADTRAMGGELMQALGGFSQEDVKKAQKDPDPLAEYDMDALLEAGIVAWSYEEEVNSDNIGQLDQKTERLIALALVGVEEEEEKVKDS